MPITSITVTSIVKNGAEITISTREFADKPFKYNINTHAFTSYTGRTVQNITPCFKHYHLSDDFDVELHDFYNFLLHAISYSKSRSYYDNDRARRDLHLVDLYYANKELLDMNTIHSIPSELPKGYINWLKSNNKKISPDTLSEFKFEQFLATAPKYLKELFDFCKNNNMPHEIKNRINRIVNMYKEYKEEELKDFCKMFKNSIKNFSWNFSKDVCDFIDYTWGGCRLSRTVNGQYVYTSAPKNWHKYIDNEQTLQLNFNRLVEIAVERENHAVENNQKRFAEIESMEFGDYIIKLPYTKNDLVLEGNNQHNCVGGYDSAIKEGRSCIYFIRRKDKPEQSYITCEFTIRGYYRPEMNLKSTQCLLKCNNRIPQDHEVWDYIKQIDEKLRELYQKSLEKEEEE